MTNATKSLLIVFVSLLVITGLVKWAGNSSSSEVFQTQIVEVDTAQVNRIVIETPTQNRTITLRRGDPGWSVTGSGSGESYPADAAAVERALGQLNELNVKAVATRDPEKHTRFKVDSTGTRVTLYDEDNELAGLVLGAPQIVSRSEFNSYVRPSDEDAVYTVEGFLGSTFGRDLDGWRDKIVWELDQDRLSRIDFLYPADSSFSIEKAGENNWVSGEDTLQSGPVSRLTSRLATLRAGGFVDSLGTDRFGSELYAIQVRLDNGVQKTLRLKPAGDASNEYRAVATDFPYLFTVNRSSFDSAVLRSRKELTGE